MRQAVNIVPKMLLDINFFFFIELLYKSNFTHTRQCNAITPGFKMRFGRLDHKWI